MNRYRHRQDAEAIHATLAMLPQAIQDILQGVNVVTGYDPAWLGLHYFHDTEDGRGYDDTCHCVYTFHQMHMPRDRRETTVVLTSEYVTNPFVVLHEFGHALDERLDFTRPTMCPINNYAARNTYESFAEAFRSWCNDTRDDEYWNRDDLAAIDPGAIAFFNTLATR